MMTTGIKEHGWMHRLIMSAHLMKNVEKTKRKDIVGQFEKSCAKLRIKGIFYNGYYLKPLQ